MPTYLRHSNQVSQIASHLHQKTHPTCVAGIADEIIITHAIVSISGGANAMDAENSDTLPTNVGIKVKSAKGMKRVKERIRGIRGRGKMRLMREKKTQTKK